MATTLRACPCDEGNFCGVHVAARGKVDLARARIALTYRWRHGRWPDLADPRTLTELIQWRKLYQRDPRMPGVADKLGVKSLVAARLGADWVTPTLWHGTKLPAARGWEQPIVVKARHGCGQNAFVLDEAFDWRSVRRQSEAWMRANYGGWLDEWLYGQIKRGLLVEPFLGTEGRPPTDWKLFVFGGRVSFVQVHLGRWSNHRWIVMDRHWRRVSPHTADCDPQPPRSLSAMIDAAEELGRDFDFVRVDFYEVDGRPRFGEMTFYPGSGLEPVEPPWLDLEMGRQWREAARLPVRALPQRVAVGERAGIGSPTTGFS